MVQTLAFILNFSIHYFICGSVILKMNFFYIMCRYLQDGSLVLVVSGSGGCYVGGEGGSVRKIEALITGTPQCCVN